MSTEQVPDGAPAELGDFTATRRLVPICLIAVGRTRSAFTICFKSALELNARAEPLGEMYVGVQHVSL